MFARFALAWLLLLAGCVYWSEDSGFGTGVDACKECSEKFDECRAKAELEHPQSSPELQEALQVCTDNKTFCAEFVSTGDFQCSASLVGAGSTGFASADQHRPRIRATVPANTSRLLAAFLSSRTFEVVPAQSGVSCAFVCDGGSPICSQVPGATDYLSELEAMRNLFASATQDIPKSEIMGIFGESDDPCGRSDVSFDGVNFSNGGQGACVASGEITILSGSDAQALPLRVDLPEMVSGTIDRQGGALVARFDDTAAPSLRILDQPDHILTGTVGSVMLRGEQILLEIEGRCLITGAPL